MDCMLRLSLEGGCCNLIVEVSGVLLGVKSWRTFRVSCGREKGMDCMWLCVLSLTCCSCLVGCMGLVMGGYYVEIFSYSHMWHLKACLIFWLSKR